MRRVTVEGLSYQAHLRQHIHLPECSSDLAEWSLYAYGKLQHGKYSNRDALEAPSNEVLIKYHIYFPGKSWAIECPAKSFQGRVMSWTNLNTQFMNWHIKYTLATLNEVNRPHHRCDRCNMFVSWKSLNVRHSRTSMWNQGE